MAQKEDGSTWLEVQLLFMMPLVVGTFGLVPWESTKKKTGQVVEIHHCSYPASTPSWLNFMFPDGRVNNRRPSKQWFLDLTPDGNFQSLADLWEKMYTPEN